MFQDLEINVPVTISSEHQHFRIEKVAGNGDCGFTAFGIPRAEAVELLLKNIESVASFLRVAIQEVLTGEHGQAFINYLVNQKILEQNSPIPKVYARYMDMIQKAASVQNIDAVLDVLVSAVLKDKNLLRGYINFDLKDKNIDFGWVHPAILQALASIQKVHLIMWRHEAFRAVPHVLSDGTDYHEYVPPNINSETKVVDLLFTNGNHFDRLVRIDSLAQEKFPKKFACACCQNILREPIAKGKIDSKFEYFHQDCLDHVLSKQSTSVDKAAKQKTLFFSGRKIKHKNYPIDDNERSTLSDAMRSHGYSLNDEENLKLKDAALRKILFSSLSTLQGIVVGREEQSGNIAPSALLRLKQNLLKVDEITGRVGINISPQALVAAQISDAALLAEDLTSKNFVTRVAVYAAAPAVVAGGGVALGIVLRSVWAALQSAEAGAPLIGEGVLATAGGVGLGIFAAVLVAGVVIYLIGRGFANKFREVLTQVADLINRREFERAENLLRSEFEERWALSKAIRWTSTESNEYAIAYLLRGEAAYHRTSENAYRYFLDAYEHAKDNTLKSLALLGMIKLLAPDSEIPILNNGVRFSAEVRSQQFDHRLQELQAEHPAILNELFQRMLEFTQALLGAIAAGNHNPEGLLQFLRAQKIASFKEPYLFRYVPQLGRKAEVVFVFLQAVTSFLGYSSEKKNNFIMETKLQLERCWKLIRQLRMDMAPVDRNEQSIVDVVRDFIIKFAKDMDRNKIFPDFDSHDWLLEINIFVDWSKSVALEHVIQTVLRCDLLIDLTALTTPEAILNCILKNTAFATHTFDSGNNCFHLIAQLPKSPQLKPLLLKVITRLSELNVSPYARNEAGVTSVHLLNVNQDPNGLREAFHSAVGMFKVSGTDKNEKYLVNNEENKEKLAGFFSTIKKNPHAKNHFSLLVGPPGVGKTELARFTANEAGFELRELPKGDSNDMWYGQYEVRIQQFFDSAIQSGRPICLFIDEMDAMVLSGVGSGIQSRVDAKAVKIIQEKINMLVGTRVVLIGATNYLERMEPAIRDRADKITFGLANKKFRKLVLEHYLSCYTLQDNSIIEKLATATAGWSLRELGLYMEKVLSGVMLGGEITLKCFENNFESSRAILRQRYQGEGIDFEPPRLMIQKIDAFDSLIMNPNVMEKSVQIKDYLENTQSYLHSIQGAAYNYVFYGPPGTGKTAFARAVAQSSDAVFINVGLEHAAHLPKIFNLVRNFEKVVIFIDEIDRLAHPDSPYKEVLQVGMNGFHQNTNACVIIGATNYKESLHKPILDRVTLVEVSLPSTSHEYLRVIQQHLSALKGIALGDTFKSEVGALAAWAFKFKISPRCIARGIREEAQRIICDRNQKGGNPKLEAKNLQLKIQEAAGLLNSQKNDDTSVYTLGARK